jgi:four helix bundle protein
MRERMTTFAVDVARLVTPLFDRASTQSLADQLQRSAASMASNYRSAGRSRSHAEFRSRIAVALEEADEALHWLQFAQRTEAIVGEPLARLIREAGELTAILAASRRTALRRAEEEAKPRRR